MNIEQMARSKKSHTRSLQDIARTKKFAEQLAKRLSRQSRCEQWIMENAASPQQRDQIDFMRENGFTLNGSNQYPHVNGRFEGHSIQLDLTRWQRKLWKDADNEAFHHKLEEERQERANQREDRERYEWEHYQYLKNKFGE